MEKGDWEFPSYEGCCAICKAPGCAKRHGFYERGAEEEDGVLMQLPIARFLCDRKGKVDADAPLTFSLLPHVLIPYKRYTVPVAYESFKRFSHGGVKEVLDEMQAVLEKFCDRTVFWIVLMFQVAFHLLTQAEFIQPTERWHQAFISLVDSYQGGLPELMFSFYVAEGRFLLGTPSQNRKKPARARSG